MDNVKNIFAKIGFWIKSIFVSVNNKEPNSNICKKKTGSKRIASILCVYAVSFGIYNTSLYQCTKCGNSYRSYIKKLSKL